MTAIASAEFTGLQRPFVVRPAEPYDLEEMVLALADFADFYGTDHSLYPGANECREQLASLIQTQPFFVVRDGIDFAGFIGGTLAGHPYHSSLRLLSEMFWWVVPEYRQTRAGLLLLEAFIAHGEAHADLIHFTLEEKSPVNERTLTKRGFHLVEKSYLREVPHA